MKAELTIMLASFCLSAGLSGALAQSQGGSGNPATQPAATTNTSQPDSGQSGQSNTTQTRKSGRHHSSNNSSTDAGTSQPSTASNSTDCNADPTGGANGRSGRAAAHVTVDRNPRSPTPCNDADMTSTPRNASNTRQKTPPVR